MSDSMSAYLLSSELYKIMWTSVDALIIIMFCLLFLDIPIIYRYCLKCGIHKSMTDSQQLS